MKRSVKLLALLTALALLVCACAAPVTEPEKTAAPAQTPTAKETAAPALYQAGTYTAAAAGRNGDVKVEVVFGADSIESVSVTEHSETAGIADPAIDKVPARIVEAQSLAVDTVAGATLTANAIIAAAKDCAQQAGADISLLMKSIETETKTVEKTAEIVVLGGGASGIAAAVSAAQSGAKSVLLLEKAGSIGGNARVSGGLIAYMQPSDVSLKAPAPEGQDDAVMGMVNAQLDDEEAKALQVIVREQYARHKEEHPELTFDSVEYYALYMVVIGMYNAGDYVTNGADSLKMSGEIQSMCQWFESMGTQFGPLTTMPGYAWPRYTRPVNNNMGVGYFATLEQQLTKYPIEIMLETPATELVTEDGKVTGAVAVAADGTIYDIHAEKAVVLATGGFAANAKMIAENNTIWKDLPEDIKSDNIGTNTGDGIVMAEAIGAGVDGLGNIMLFHQCNPVTGTMNDIIGNAIGMLVDGTGRRFVNETLSREIICQAIFDLEEPLIYMISDANGCGIRDGIGMFGNNAEEMIEKRQLYRADTIEELAELMGADPAVLAETVASFNDAASTGVDPEFGRAVYVPENRVETAPFYACPRVVSAHLTRGGVLRNIDWQVLDTSGNVIPGLYVIGECAFNSMGISRAFSEGYVLGTNLLK